MCHAVLFFIHIPSSYHAAALHESSVPQYHASMSSEEQILLSFSCGFDLTRQNQERGRKRVRKEMMAVLCSNVNGASVPILLVLIVHYMVQVSAPLLHHLRLRVAYGV